MGRGSGFNVQCTTKFLHRNCMYFCASFCFLLDLWTLQTFCQMAPSSSSTVVPHVSLTGRSAPFRSLTSRTRLRSAMSMPRKWWANCADSSSVFYKPLMRKSKNMMCKSIFKGWCVCEPVVRQVFNDWVDILSKSKPKCFVGRDYPSKHLFQCPQSHVLLQYIALLYITLIRNFYPKRLPIKENILASSSVATVFCMALSKMHMIIYTQYLHI